MKSWIYSGEAVIRVNPRTVATENTAPASTDEATISLQRSIYDPGYVNAMSHFYRGELAAHHGLAATARYHDELGHHQQHRHYHHRLLPIADVPHIIFFFNLAIVWVMLWIESRRYRFYDAFRARVRMLEAHFLVPMVMENRADASGRMEKAGLRDLILPSFKISKLEAIGRRLKRNYVFIFILIMVAMACKIFLARLRTDHERPRALPRPAGWSYSLLAGGAAVLSGPLLA